MRLSVELYTEKPLSLKPQTFINLSLRSHGFILPESKGIDKYENYFMVLTNKRIAGIGREKTYRQNSFTAGLGSFQAKPGTYIQIKEEDKHDLTLIIENDLIYDPGILKDSLGVRLVNAKGKIFDIPLKRPDLQIHWTHRGRFVVPIYEFTNSKIFRCA